MKQRSKMKSIAYLFGKNVLSIDEEKGGLFIAMFDPKRFASLMVCNRKNMKRKVQDFFYLLWMCASKV